jgi:NAD(P)-dependent dehydrogenase (short-subunit alcohol dehydrogenase family)
MGRNRYGNPFTATVNGILEKLKKTQTVGKLEDRDRVDGRVALVTGANRGLGRAVAIGLAARGAHVIMGCRSGFPEAAEEVKSRSRSLNVEMARLDLADFASIHRFCDELKESGVRLDLTVLNAGAVPARSRRTRQGFDVMFGVNYLANFVLVNRLLRDGTIPNGSFAAVPSASGTSRVGVSGAPGTAKGEKHLRRPRIVFVSSEAHRTAEPLDFAKLGRFVSYGMRGSMREYGKSKLCLSTYAVELSRRLKRDRMVDVAVHALCPGPVNTGIAREAPLLFRPLLKIIFWIFFKSPRKAAEPVLYLCCSPTLEGQTGVYLYLMTRREFSDEASDPQKGGRLWKLSELLVEKGSPQ